MFPSLVYLQLALADACAQIIIYVERNLGFEAEHMERELRNEPNVVFYKDVQASRVGVLTTENVKLGAMTTTNVLLRERRIHMMPCNELVSTDPIAIRVKMQEQLAVYSLQFKVRHGLSVIGFNRVYYNKTRGAGARERLPEEPLRPQREGGRAQGRSRHLPAARHLLDGDAAGHGDRHLVFEERDHRGGRHVQRVQGLQGHRLGEPPLLRPFGHRHGARGRLYP